MEYIVSASTDKGIKKDTNQDSLAIKVADTSIGKIALVLVCDGMGGLQQGEVASASLTQTFADWFDNRLPLILQNGLSDIVINNEWNNIIQMENEKIYNYGSSQGIHLGTTIVAGLFTPDRYYIVNVGDSRAYELYDRVMVITEDQTLVESEYRRGLITREQADIDPRRSVLLQCVGANKNVTPQMYYGATKTNVVYMLCSDGFRHVITPEEIYGYLGPAVSVSKEAMDKNGTLLIEINKSRKEEDNITVCMVRTY